MMQAFFFLYFLYILFLGAFEVYLGFSLLREKKKNSDAAIAIGVLICAVLSWYFAYLIAVQP